MHHLPATTIARETFVKQRLLEQGDSQGKGGGGRGERHRRRRKLAGRRLSQILDLKGPPFGWGKPTQSGPARSAKVTPAAEGRQGRGRGRGRGETHGGERLAGVGREAT